MPVVHTDEKRVRGDLFQAERVLEQSFLLVHIAISGFFP
jgi:hypothetical protein